MGLRKSAVKPKSPEQGESREGRVSGLWRVRDMLQSHENDHED